MKKLCALTLLIGSSPAWAQAPCTRAPAKAKTSFFAEPISGGAKDTVLVVRLCLASAKSVGSYMATITFDSTRMRVTRVDAPAGMQATNAKTPGIVRIAGAAPAGFANGELARIGFSSARKAFDRISVAVSEANSIAGISLLSETETAGWPRSVEAATRPVIDSISPRMGEIDSDRVTDITIYGRGFAPVGNLVLFATAQVPGLMSEAGGTVIRFSAPSIRVSEGKAPIRVKHDGMQSNAVTFRVKDDNQ